MFYLDKKLLLLYDFIENHEFDRRQIAERLEVSDRHLTRLLNLWHEEGVIEYKKGRAGASILKCSSKSIPRNVSLMNS